jgi:hypothetical protein
MDKIVTEAMIEAAWEVFRHFDAKWETDQFEAMAGAIYTAMSTAQERALDDDAEWRLLAGDLCRAMRIDVGEITLHWAETFLRSIAERLQAKAPDDAL